jgi:hypothetical protein
LYVRATRIGSQVSRSTIIETPSKRTRDAGDPADDRADAGPAGALTTSTRRPSYVEADTFAPTIARALICPAYCAGKSPLPAASGGPGARLTLRATVSPFGEFQASVRVPSGWLVTSTWSPGVCASVASAGGSRQDPSGAAIAVVRTRPSLVSRTRARNGGAPARS